MVKPIFLPTEDFPSAHEKWSEVLSMLDASEKRIVPRRPQYPSDTCYRNTRVHSAQSGGDPHYGWMIEWVPGVYIQAMHHAVWKMRDGKLIDITEAQHRASHQFSATSFVPDQRLRPDKNDSAMIEHVFLELVRDNNLTAYMNAYRINNAARRDRQLLEVSFIQKQISETKYKQEVDRINSTLNLSYEKIHHHRLAIKNSYF